ncbi:MAG: HAMP domain-containing histidine kinase [Acholeplasmatales bacterium]|nr:HAMP domain-containing histidine kinase [Acholeplasmatales bacterium]
MRKISLSSQLVLIFFGIFIFATALFSVVSVSTTIRTVEDEMYTKLQSYSQFMDGPARMETDVPDIDFGVYLKFENTTNSNLRGFIEEDEVNNIVAEVTNLKTKSNDPRHSFNVKGIYTNKKNQKIYYFYETRDETNFRLVLTDTKYTNARVQSTVLINCTIFLGVMLLTICVLFFWSNGLAKRLKKIQNHILLLPSSKYENEYVDDGMDEVGTLSRSVEHMRKEISTNEKTKQEMLQNLSHDFKTPIAVIKTYAEAMVDGVEDVNSATAKIIEQADILKNKVNKLLQYNSLEYLSKDKEFEDVVMNEIINDLVKNYKYQLADIDFELDLEDDVTFKGYRENWYTVVDNIIDNAKRYAKTKIKIVLRKGYLRIYNDGEHISEDFINSSFKPYEKGSKGQFGLGMSIAQKTIYFFGMKLVVKNEEVGVSFIIEE